MKTLAVFALVVLVGLARALPLAPEVAEVMAEEVAQEVEEVEGRGFPPHLAVEEEDSDSGSSELVRERRSPGGWQQGGSRPQSPQPRPQESRGSISGGVHRERGVGTVVHAQGRGTVWTSRSGNARLDAQGEYSRVVRGPARGKPNYNVGVTYTRRF